VPNPGLDPRGLYAAIAIEFGLPGDGTSEVLLHRLERHFITLAQNDQQPVVLIDEAQALPADTLEAVRFADQSGNRETQTVAGWCCLSARVMARCVKKVPADSDSNQLSCGFAPARQDRGAAYVLHRLV